MRTQGSSLINEGLASRRTWDSNGKIDACFTFLPGDDNDSIMYKWVKKSAWKLKLIVETKDIQIIDIINDWLR